MKKHHKRNNQLIKLFLSLFIPLILLGITLNTSESSVMAADETVVTPKFKPADPPKKFLGIWMSNGYGLQPPADSYTSLNEPVTLRTSAGRSIWSVLGGLLDGDHYRWWQTTDGMLWTAVSEDDFGYRRNFTVTPTEVGTVWYQLDTAYYTLITPWLQTNIYSQVAAVHTLKDPITATSIDVTVDDDYLYNSKDAFANTTYAHVTPTPGYATGNVTWSVDKPELATVDEDGQVIANAKSLSGTVEVIATWTNPDESTIVKSVPVEIGNGIDDQTVRSGQAATFFLRGNAAQDMDVDGVTASIAWYKNGSKISKATDTSYTTPITSLSDDGTMFNVTFTFKKLISSKSVSTNKARLNVIPFDDPDIAITNSMVNESYSNEASTANKLVNVVNGDKVTYYDTLTNNSTEGPLKAASYVIPLHAGTGVDSVVVNGTTLTIDKDYSIVPNATTGTDDLVINVNDIISQSSKAIEVKTTVKNIAGTDSLKFTPYVYGTSNSDTIYRKDGTKEEIYYTGNSVLPNVHSIDYGTITPYHKNALLYRPKGLNNPNNIVQIDDQRRDKNAMTVSVNQLQDFTNENGDVLSASLRYYKDGDYTSILNRKTTISESDSGDDLSSISWNKEDGLLLYIDGNNMTTGNYSTTLSWYFENSI